MPNQKLIQKRFARRRLVVLGLGLLIVLLFCYGIYAAVSGVIDTIKEHNEAKEQAKIDADNNTFDKDCLGGDIRLEASITTPNATVASGAHITLRTTYLGATGCKISTASPERILTITSGNDVIYTSGGCQIQDSGLVFLKGESDQSDVAWNLKRTGADGCASGEVVSQGYYVAHITYPEIPNLTANDVGFYVEKEQ